LFESLLPMPLVNLFLRERPAVEDRHRQIAVEELVYLTAGSGSEPERSVGKNEFALHRTFSGCVAVDPHACLVTVPEYCDVMPSIGREA
jgi:hypothetical protein